MKDLTETDVRTFDARSNIDVLLFQNRNLRNLRIA
jgi:hypothetical protein